MPTRTAGSNGEYVHYLTRRMPLPLYKRLKNCMVKLQPDGRATLQETVNEALMLGLPLLEKKLKDA